MKCWKHPVAAAVFAVSISASASPPNILFVFADDWGWGDLGCHNHPYLKTPNIDQLAKQGTEFYQFTVASGVCSPSRAAVMTGQFPARHGIHGHFATVESHVKRDMPDWLNPKSVLLPRLLQNAGYATAHYGKWHLTNTMVKDAPLPSEYGYDDHGVFNCSGPQMPVHDDVVRASEFIKRSAAAEKPFFINFWIHEPHTPHYPKPEYLQLFPELEEADQIYAAVLAHADARIGKLMATIEELNITENTLIIFSSDNGPENTSPRRTTEDISTGPGVGTFASVGTTGGHRGRKRSLLQGGIGVPFIAKWPGKIPAGKIDDTTPLTAVDLLPTLCAIANAPIPDSFQPDGIDLSSALLGTPTELRSKPVFWQWKNASKRGDNWPTLAVREGGWKLLLGKDANPTELFRFPGDRLEKNDLQAANPTEVTRLRGLIDEWQATISNEPWKECVSKDRR